MDKRWTKGPYYSEQCMRLDGTSVQEWTIQSAGRLGDDEPTIIAGVFTSKRDAALLAAAPDLAEAMPDLSHVISWLENGCHISEAIVELRSYQKRIDAALAKARGEA